MDWIIFEWDTTTVTYQYLDPLRVIAHWYDLLTDPYAVIKKKCKPTSPQDWEAFEVEEVCYIAWVFTEDKIRSPSFADEKDTVLNNIILSRDGTLLQMYFATNRDTSGLSSEWMRKISVREYKKWREVIAREFIGYLQ